MTDHDDDDNPLTVFDEDDALDYIIYSEMQKEDMQGELNSSVEQDRTDPEGEGGCLGLVLLVLLPLPLLSWLASYI